MGPWANRTWLDIVTTFITSVLIVLSLGRWKANFRGPAVIFTKRPAEQ